jgi:hypothetical protein
MCEFFATFSNPNWLTAYASVGLLGVTAWAARNVRELTLYSHRQNDRDSLEKIYLSYHQAIQLFVHNVDPDLCDLRNNRVEISLVTALGLSRFYKQDDISKFILEIIVLLRQATKDSYLVHGTDLNFHRRGSIDPIAIVRLQDTVSKITDMFVDVSLFTEKIDGLKLAVRK